MKKALYILLPLVIAIFAISCDGSKKTDTDANAVEKATDSIAQDVADDPATFSYLPDSLINPDADAVIYTRFGAIQVMLYDETPRHRDNFLKLAAEGFFDGTLFHRVIKDFMVQGGDPDSRNAHPNMQLGNGGPGYTIPAEFNPKFLHKRGALSAARQGDFANPKKESSGSQFYIVQGKKYSNEELSQIEAQSGIPMEMEVRRMYRTLGGTPFLDHEYTVFGEVLEGMDVVDRITQEAIDANNRPLSDVRMEVRVVERNAGE